MSGDDWAGPAGPDMPAEDPMLIVSGSSSTSKKPIRIIYSYPRGAGKTTMRNKFMHRNCLPFSAIGAIIAVVLVLGLFFGFCIGDAKAAEAIRYDRISVSETDGVRAVLGESGPKYEEMLALAFAIRNRINYNVERDRDPMQGIYGYRRVTKDFRAMTAEPEQLWKAFPEGQIQKAMRAWGDSDPDNIEFQGDPTDGADHWLSDWDLKHCKPRLTAFRFAMVETAYIGTTHFYRESK